YIKDMMKAKDVLDELGIILNDFKPNTVRLRKYGNQYYLTLKDRGETKKREVEYTLDKKVFNKFWPLTKGSRAYKTRMVEEIKGYKVEMDAFTDRYLIIAEIEVVKEKELDKVPKLGMDITGNKD